MGMLESVQSGRENKPPRIMIYGSEGVGKSTFGASAPNAIFVQTEDGLGEINCRKFPLAHNLSEVLAELTALRDEPHEYLTVVIDSADWLERLIFDEVCKEFGVRSIEKADGGYGKGYVHALTHWRKIIALLHYASGSGGPRRDPHEVDDAGRAATAGRASAGIGDGLRQRGRDGNQVGGDAGPRQGGVQ